MRKGKTIIGKDVLSLTDGRKLHTVKDVIIASDGTSIVALLIDPGGLLGASRVVPIEYVESFGKDAVVISEAQGLVPADAYPAVKETLDTKQKLLGKKVFTETGDEQGSITDLYFDEETGQIQGFEVSRGAVSNLTSGASYLPVEDIVRSGPDVVYIRPESAEALESQVGGVRGALQSAGEKAGGALDTAKEKAGQAAEGVKSKVDEARGGDSAPPEEQVVGRRSPVDVEDDRGAIILAGGQRIEPRHVDRLRENGKLDAVLEATGVRQQGQGPALGQQLSATGSRVGEQASDALAQAGDSAGGLWDQFTRKLTEMTDATGKRIDETQTKARLGQIEDAIGRPVTKVILDRDDNVVLNLGDIITHQAVQRAYDSGALDSLLASVYKGDVAFTRDEMMAPQEGTATVEKASGGAVIVEELEQKLQQADQERQAQKEESRAQAEEQRQQREQERQQRAEQREQQAATRDAEASAAAEQSTKSTDSEDQQETQSPDDESSSATGSTGAEPKPTLVASDRPSGQPESSGWEPTETGTNGHTAPVPPTETVDLAPTPVERRQR